MARPVVAIVGRPNVGKSTLFNKLVGRRLSIVDDTPGVTRDRIFGDCEWLGRHMLLVDTGGIEPYSDDVILSQMRTQAQLAIESADVLVLVTDLRSGVTATDEEVAAMVGDIRSNYETVPEVRSILDEYCSGAGITIEAYFQRIEAEAPATLTRQKLKNHILGSYAETHPDASSEELEAAYQAYREALYAEHEDEITLYIAH